MAPARRSSARLQASTTPQKQVVTPASASKLSALVERDETPDRGVQPVLNSIAASVPAKATTRGVPDNSTLSTPTTGLGIRPSSQEMHPSRHQSTAKKLNSAKLTDFVTAHASTQSPSINRTSNLLDMAGHGSSSHKPFSSPNFEFRFTRPSTELSREAQRMMDEVREQAAKIKSELAIQRREQDSQIGSRTTSGRKVMSAKGKIGRFSDVHMEQFKKMNSIADHPSSFRADASKSLSANRSLKRSNSKAGLDKSDGDLTRSPSTKREPPKVSRAISSPAKRLKKSTAPSPVPDWPFTNPAEKDNMHTFQKHGSDCATTAASLSTPTKAVLARSTSAKSLKSGKSKIPSLAHSPSTKTLNTPQALKSLHPHTDGKVRSTFADKLVSVKSILRRPQFKFSDDPVKLAAGTHISTPERTAAMAGKEKELLFVPNGTPGSPANRKEKHVNFSSSPDDLIPPSPFRSPRSPTQLVRYPNLLDAFEDNPSPTNTKIGAGTLATGPSDFTFRADKTIRFAPPPATTPTIRHVRASDTSIFRGASITIAGLPSVPHGLSNKKRKRESTDENDIENKENVEQPQDFPEKPRDMDQSPTKRVKILPRAQPSPLKTPKGGKLKTPTKSVASASKRRGILSLSRLHALSRPKQR